MQSHFAQLANIVHDSSLDPDEDNDSPETAS